jgi:hypothetical protein
LKKEWFALGLILIVAGFAFLYFSNTSVYVNNYVQIASIDNSVNYNKGYPLQLNITAHYDVGQRFFFNFSKGRFWGVQYDQEVALEPPNMMFAPNASIEAYKTAEFYVYTPSGDMVVSEVYLVGGKSIFAVTYLNQSADFVPLSGGNLSFYYVGIEGIVERSGNYTITANDIEPYVMQSATQQYTMQTDPPLQMYLWNLETTSSKPYLVSSVSVSGVLFFVGAVTSVWAGRPKRRGAHVRSTR